MVSIAQPANQALAEPSPPGGGFRLQPKFGHQTPTEAETADLAVIASNEKISVAEANRRYGWQEEFTQAVTVVTQRYPETYADASMPSTESSVPFVSFVGVPPREIAGLFATIPVPVEIRGGARFSAIQVQANIAEVTTAAVDAFEGRASIEPQGDGVIVSVDEAEAAKDRRSPQLRLSQALGVAKTQNIDVAVRVVPDSKSGQTAVVYGGGPLSTCTSGFTVRRTSGATQKGVVTADHCSNSQYYEHVRK